MPNYIEYQQSIATEFKAYENRVRNIIDGHHWGEDGRYKEIILINYLKRVLPQNVSVGTGFAKSNKGITNQIDIIIYDATFPMLFSEGDFVIVIPESVLGIIEVKSNINNGRSLEEYIKKANDNAYVICGEKDKSIFNGIFSYQCGLQQKTITKHIKQLDYSEILEKQHFNQIYSNRLKNCVNHIVCSSEVLLKLCVDTECDGGTNSRYNFYKMPEDLAVGYFISNLQESILIQANKKCSEKLPEGLRSFFYPLQEGKEPYCMEKIILRKKRK